jgi:hypothetical protein
MTNTDICRDGLSFPGSAGWREFSRRSCWIVNRRGNRKTITTKFITAILLVTVSAVFGQSPDTRPVAGWNFDDDRTNDIRGATEFAPGVRGRCLILDGLTTHLVLPASQVPEFKNQFTVAAWLALGAYPLNWAPVADWHDPNRCGLFFGVDAHGRFGLAVRAGESWQPLTSTNAIPLRQWHHVAGTLSGGGEMKLFLDGKPVAAQKIAGRFVAATNLDLLVGRHRFKAKPEGAIRPDSNAEVFAFLDGALDELEIFDRALSEPEIASRFSSARAPKESPLRARVLPTGPPGPFGAFYTKLKFYPQWDNAWRVGDFADVVVRFGGLPFQFIFWRGTSYVPNWVTENGIWFNNEFNETWSGVKGCGEPMSDKQCRYSNVRILENSEARCVVHWRYALTDVFYHIAREDDASGWGDWSDEVYTIYPDGISVRDVTLHSSHPEQPHEWQESIVVMGPGFSPENSLDPRGLTLVDAAGEKVDYSWERSTPPHKPGRPEHPCIQVCNTKSKFKPFTILRAQDADTFDIFSSENRRGVSLYPWWNHWPAATFASDGRYAMAADRPSHSSLTHLYWKAYQTGPQWMRKIMLAGLAEQSATSLLPLMRSWSHPAELELDDHNFQNLGYDPAQKAYVLKRTKAGAKLSFRVAANADSPVVNPALVILDWGDSDPHLEVSGREIPRGEAFRWGHRQTIDSEDLVVWLKLNSPTTCKILIRSK